MNRIILSNIFLEYSPSFQQFAADRLPEQEDIVLIFFFTQFIFRAQQNWKVKYMERETFLLLQDISKKNHQEVVIEMVEEKKIISNKILDC